MFLSNLTTLPSKLRALKLHAATEILYFKTHIYAEGHVVDSFWQFLHGIKYMRLLQKCTNILLLYSRQKTLKLEVVHCENRY